MVMQIQTALKILRRRHVEAKTGLARSSIYQRIAAGSFPKPINLGGPRAVGWVESEIDQWIEERMIASRKEEQ
ncbi:transcriptional regulator, AlpA family [Noviherbaspirillum humi]|uniref:Transcriptional regulator, AlpA family n=1 Tax=Noviherbaspirillum humi TaxID=1688639 RepID=A0A239LIC0_9BURK|nr:AlpA family transcriptional regulator [Noviherbaspirillum humi]SNT30336.1 transcriptional regulator, AlpA family [Noviherbaspirillum humi]